MRRLRGRLKLVVPIAVLLLIAAACGGDEDGGEGGGENGGPAYEEDIGTVNVLSAMDPVAETPAIQAMPLSTRPRWLSLAQFQ